MDRLVPRHAADAVRDALADTRVVFIEGARQVGKSTLARDVLAGVSGARFVDLDDPVALRSASEDPTTFVRHAGTLGIDEVQRAPDLLLAIKRAVDRDPRPGRFLLTGSAAVLAVPGVADSLAGRVEIVELGTFSQGEIAGVRERFVDRLLSGSLPLLDGDLVRADYLERATLGGYPEVLRRTTAARRARWFTSYLRTLVLRDVRELSDIERIEEFPRILALVGARTSTLLNVSRLARDAGVPVSTMRRYLALAEAAFIVRRVPAWHTNRTSRLVKAPKLVVNDSGLAATMLGLSPGARAVADHLAGPLTETFATTEIAKQLSWAETRATLFHLRTDDGVEVDMVLEAPDGRIAGIEVKSGATVHGRDTRGLEWLRARAGERFVGGVVLYAGEFAVPVGDRLWALPISSLWAR